MQLASIRVCSVLLFLLMLLVQPSPARGDEYGPLARQGEASVGAGSEVALATVYQGLVATAVRDGSGNLSLIAWRVSGDPAGNTPGAQHIVRKGDASASAMSEIAIANMGGHLVVTAGRDGGGNLKLVAWHFSDDGLTIEHGGEASAGAISKVAIVSLNTSQFVTAVRDGGGNLKLIVWSISSDGKTIVRKGATSAGKISKVALVSTGKLGAGSGLVTVLRDGGGKLKLIAWHVSKNGLTVKRGGDASAGAVSELAAAWVTTRSDPGLANERELVATAVRDAGGNLKLISWEVANSAGQKIVRKGGASWQAISKVAATRVATLQKPERLITAVRDGSGNLTLVDWDFPSSGQVVRKEDASAGAVSDSDIAVDECWMYYLVTAARDGSGNLNLIGWKHYGP